MDSSRQHEQAWQRLGQEEHRLLPKGYFVRSFGMRNENVIPELLGWTNDPDEIRQLSLRKEAIFRELIRGEKLQSLPGAEDWLERLSRAAIPCAVASSTPRENIRCVIDKLDLDRCFQAIVCGEDVAHGKPDPEVFLLAASKLAAPPARCVVFEDAHVGIEAARRAGMKVVGVATTHPPEALHKADKVVRRLSDLKVAEIAAWFGE